MRQSIENLQAFYDAPFGRAAQTMCTRRLRALWPDLSGLDVLGYGYTQPHLASYHKDAHRMIYANPEEQGGGRLVVNRGNTALRVRDHQLPFPPGIFDRVLVAHGFEEAARPAALLDELWRVMKPEGRIVVIAANRIGLWAGSEKTPFGAGRPFSRRQLSNALRAAQFETLVRSGALYAPPLKFCTGPKMSGLIEKFGETVWPGFSGLVLVEAIKRLYAGHSGRAAKPVKRPTLAGAGALGISGKVIGTSELAMNDA